MIQGIYTGGSPSNTLSSMEPEERPEQSDLSSNRQSPFLKVGRLFPQEVEPLCIQPAMAVKDALRLMVENRYSQLPVLEDGEVLGAFSFWSLAEHMVHHPNVAVDDLVVDDVIQKLPSVTVEDSLHSLLKLVEDAEAVFLVSPRGIQAVITAWDVLDYFYKVAKPYVLLWEIELALRDAITYGAPDERLAQTIERAIGQKYRDASEPLPLTLHDLSFEDYRMIIVHSENWALFEGVLGHNRQLVGSKLKGVRDIRNRVFHFKDDITIGDHQDLMAVQEWLHDRLSRLDRRIQADREKSS